MDDCIFCKIIQGEIQALKIYEDENFIAFLDINPRTKGHSLVIPKTHYETFIEMDDDLVSKIGLVVKHIAKTLIEKLNATGFNILNNNGESAGQVVKHIHIHILPRYGEKGHAMESAFPVDEEEKNNLEKTYKLIIGE